MFNPVTVALQNTVALQTNNWNLSQDIQEPQPGHNRCRGPNQGTMALGF